MLLAVEDERRPATRDEVELLVAVLLAVLLDDAVARLSRRVGVAAERLDSEPAPNRPPDESLVVDLEAVELVEVSVLVRDH